MKKISLSIPKPCHENWDAMTPEEKGRFCGACQKAVIDFSEMSDRQLAQFFKKPPTNVCGRFNNEQLDRNIVAPKKRLPWIKYFFTIALPAFLVSLKASGQKATTETKGKGAVCTNRTLGMVGVAYSPVQKKDTVKIGALLTKFNPKEGRMEVIKTFKSRVVNSKGEPVPFATIVAKDEGRITVADSLGFFGIKYFVLPLTLDVSSIGYQPRTILYNREADSNVVLQQANYSTFSAGEVIITSVRKKKNTVPLLPPKKTDTAFAKFSVYPNPVNANGMLTVDPKSLDAGKYDLAIVSSNGNIVQSSPMIFEKEKSKQTIDLRSIPAGVYFVRLSNSKTGKTFSEKIIVQ